ncbi:MAG TPA: VOC family protein [Steroidobacteraceae bacterium]|jgi:uncharacterized glyoxalase superfamily protein PhnB
MLKNRSIPCAVVIPELAYTDVAEAAEWLCDAFGFEERLRIGNHRAQLLFGEGSVVVTQRRPQQDAAVPPGESRAPMRGEAIHSVMVRVENVDRHHARAVEQGVQIVHPPADYPYGERQYTAQDLGGHVWTFSQTIADVDPATWGGKLPERASG